LKKNYADGAKKGFKTGMSGNTRIQNSINNMLTGVLARVANLILQMIYRSVFIQVLGLTYLSVNGLFSNILTIFSFAELGIGEAIVFSLYKPIKEQNYEKIRGLMQLYKKTYCIIGLIVWGLGLAFVPFLPYMINGTTEGIENLTLIYLLFVFDTGVSYFFSYRQAYMTACQEQYYLNIWSSIFTILNKATLIVAILIFKQFVPVLVISCIWTIIQNAVISGLVVRKHKYIKNTNGCSVDKSEKVTIVKNIKALMIYKVGTLALNSTDNIIITTVVGLNWVGLYSNYQVLVSAVTSFISTLFSSITASIGNLNADVDGERKEEMFYIVNFASFWIYSISAVCFFVALSPTVSIWLGEEYLINKTTVFVIALNIYIGGMLFAPFTYRQTMGLFVYGKMRPIISAIINIVVSIILGKFIGLTGVLLGTIIARMTTNVWFDPYIVYKKGFKKNSKKYFLDYLIYLILLLLGFMLGTFISKIILFGGLIDIIIHCLLCFACISTIYCIIFYRTNEFKYLWMVVKNILTNIRKKLNQA
jgi:O-antigen/teichoic acid export membrane protein